MGKLTDMQLREWVRAGKPIAGKSDGDGLTFTLSKKGTAAWVLRYRFGSKQREITLGRYPDLSLKAARKRATEERVAIGNGIDVGLEKQREKRARAAAKTFKELAEDYLIKIAPSLASTTQKETKRILKKDINHRIASMRTRDITGAYNVYLVETIANLTPRVALRP